MHVTAQIALSDFSANQNSDGSMRVEFSHLPTGLPIQAIDWVFLHQLETVATTFAGTTPRPSLRSTAPDVPLAGITSPNSMAPKRCPAPCLPRLFRIKRQPFRVLILKYSNVHFSVEPPRRDRLFGRQPPSLLPRQGLCVSNHLSNCASVRFGPCGPGAELLTAATARPRPRPPASAFPPPPFPAGCTP